jgi:hypothetical protein
MLGETCISVLATLVYHSQISNRPKFRKCKTARPFGTCPEK